MAINFPSTTGQATDGSFTHTASGVTWAWDGTSWKAQGVTGSYVLGTATATSLGGIKVGSGLSINSTTSVLSTSAIALGGLSDVSTAGAISGQILKFNGTSWALASDDDLGGVTIQEEGNSLSTSATTLNFVGANVTATGTGATKTITVSGSGGSLQTRTTANGTTSSIANDASADLTIVAAKTYVCLLYTSPSPRD